MRNFFDAARQLVAPNACPGCDAKHDIGGDGFCEACESLIESHADGTFAFEYGGPISEAIRKLKYAGRIDYARPLGRLLADFARALTVHVDVIVPLPLHRRRFIERGYNQSALLAQHVAKRYALPLDLRMLTRTRPTLEQVSLAADLRQHNVSDAFEATPHARERRILLIDDVRTTGATLSAASDALLAAGAERVIAIALAGRT